MSIECGRCKTANPDGAKFCAECGNSLAPQVVAFQEFLDSTLRDRVKEIFDKNYRDQKVVEIETTQAIADRFLGWSKLLGVVAGIPIALLLVVLSVLGIKTYSDFTGKIDAGTAKVAEQLATAEARVKKLRQEGDTLEDAYKELRTRYNDTSELADQLNVLSTKVDAIGEKLGFTPTSKISAEGKHQLKATFARFQNYLMGLGPQGAVGPVSIDVRDKMDGGMISYYDPSKRMMVIDSKYISESAVIFRESAHNVLVPKGMPGATPHYAAIESGLAWYLPCSFIGDPNPARSVSSWDLTKKRQFAEIRSDAASALTDGTEIWGGAFWELRQRLGQSTTDKLLFEAWFAISPDYAKTDRGASFVRKVLEIGKPHEAEIRAVFAERGFPV
jgi:hypothetical protein